MNLNHRRLKTEDQNKTEIANYNQALNQIDEEINMDDQNFEEFLDSCGIDPITTNVISLADRRKTRPPKMKTAEKADIKVKTGKEVTAQEKERKENNAKIIKGLKRK